MDITLHKTSTGYIVGGVESGKTYKIEVPPKEKFHSFDDFCERYLAPIEAMENNIAAFKSGTQSAREAGPNSKIGGDMVIRRPARKN